VEYHPTLALAGHMGHPTYLILDIDPPEGGAFCVVVRAAHLVREALAGVGLAGAVKTSGAKGVHVFVPITADVTMEDAAAATRAIARRAEQLDPRTALEAQLECASVERFRLGLEPRGIARTALLERCARVIGGQLGGERVDASDDLVVAELARGIPHRIDPLLPVGHVTSRRRRGAGRHPSGPAG